MKLMENNFLKSWTVYKSMKINAWTPFSAADGSPIWMTITKDVERWQEGSQQIKTF